MSRRIKTVAILVIATTALAGTVWYTRWRDPVPAGAPNRPTGGKGGWPGAGAKGGGMPVPVRTAIAQEGSIDVTLDVLGSVTARTSVIVRARVDGLLEHIRFKEGAEVHEHDVLADIDARPYQAALKQTEGQLARDEALLESAKVDLERYRMLLTQDSIAKQQVDDQTALVHQYEGVVLSDRGTVEAARLNLGWTHISAPISGRVGLRQVDVGNMVHTADAAGIVILTQTQPINVTFAVPAEKASALVNHLHRGGSVAVDALDRDGKTLLARGHVESADNVVDPATSTVKLKSLYDNRDGALLPNQFVNARVTLQRLDHQVLIPATAVQHGTPGAYVYLVGPDHTVSVRVIIPGPQSADRVAIAQGLAVGDEVVIDGTDKLHAGSKIMSAHDAPAAAADPAYGHHGKRGGHAPPLGEPRAGTDSSVRSTMPQAPPDAESTRSSGWAMHPGAPPDEAARAAWRRRREAERSQPPAQP